ncbi:hypothetical protein VDG05_13445 [Xanthomonas campestris pv. raphani]|uniref:hypothetical protein n=1 Tax=Xanthomonas campestris TaxID=339 RepID=UPI002B22DBAA|nr:hypothetical protein [Xanthomonas campestris]MEA9885336.1 hypothetical protein [Xanthomonas campestris pv. raphani]MEB2183351.1 hypothetical protein [Xanthomonas campestris pv. campestris]
MFNRKTTRTVVVDGQTMELSDAAAAAIERLHQRLADAEAVSQRVRADQAAAVDTRDAEIARLQTELARLQDSRPKPEDIDRLVDERVRRITDSSASVQPPASTANLDPVAQALRDGATHRQPVKDNGWSEMVASLDYRTRKQEH